MSSYLYIASDPEVISNSTINVFKHLAPSEVKSFCEDEFADGSHVFIDLVIMVMAQSANIDSDMYKIYDLTKLYLSTSREDVADDLIDLVSKVSKLGNDEIISMF